MAYEVKIITPHAAPENWTPPADCPVPWAIPSQDECVIPPTVRETGVERVLNRKVTGASVHLGTYGMGGAGLVGFELEENELFPKKDYLVLCLWGADCWLHWDGKIIDDNKTYGDLWGTETESQKGCKTFEAEVLNATLKEFHLHDKHCKLVFDDHLLVFDEDPKTRPRFHDGDLRELGEVNLPDAWFVSPTSFIVV